MSNGSRDRKSNKSGVGEVKNTRKGSKDSKREVVSSVITRSKARSIASERVRLSEMT